MTSGWPIFSPLTRKWFSPLIFTSKHFRKKKERERERARAREEKKPNSQVIPGGADLQSELQAAPIFSSSSRRRDLAKIAISRRRDIAIARSRRRELAPQIAIDGAISRRREIAPSRARALDRAVASSRLRSRSTARSRAVARSRSQIDRDLAPLIARSRRRDRDRWWYFSWVCVFLFLFQTPKNIFQKIFWNATKHREIFSFSGN